MLTWYDLGWVILCYYSLSLIQPFLDKILQATLLKIGGKILSYAITKLPSKYAKIKNSKKEPQDFIKEGIPIIVEKFQKNGINGIQDLINSGLMNLIKNTEIKIKKPDENVETEEAKILAEHRKNKAS